MTDTQIPDVAELEQQLAAARAAEATRLEEQMREARERERAYRRKWLEEHDPRELRRAVAAAEMRLMEAFAETPAFAALAEAQAARFIQMRATQTAHNHRAWLALDAGQTPPHDPGVSNPPDLDANVFINTLGRLVAERIDEWETAENEAFAEGVYGTSLTHEEILEAEQQLEQHRRIEAARISSQPTVDATTLTTEDRDAMGLPQSQRRNSDAVTLPTGP